MLSRLGQTAALIVLCTCFYSRWNTSHTDQQVKLVFVWVTTATVFIHVASYAAKQQDLIIIGHGALKHLCPLRNQISEL